MNEFDEESNESHQSETDGGSESNLLEFYNRQKFCKNKKSSNSWVFQNSFCQQTFSVWLGALLDKAIWVLHELFAWLDVLVDGVHVFACFTMKKIVV